MGLTTDSIENENFIANSRINRWQIDMSQSISNQTTLPDNNQCGDSNLSIIVHFSFYILYCFFVVAPYIPIGDISLQVIPSNFQIDYQNETNKIIAD